MSAYTADGKRKSCVHVCGACGKRCRGNGGWSSHRKACAKTRLARGEYVGAMTVEQLKALVGYES